MILKLFQKKYILNLNKTKIYGFEIVKEDIFYLKISKRCI